MLFFKNNNFKYTAAFQRLNFNSFLSFHIFLSHCFLSYYLFSNSYAKHHVCNLYRIWNTFIIFAMQSITECWNRYWSTFLRGQIKSTVAHEFLILHNLMKRTPYFLLSIELLFIDLKLGTHTK